MLLERPPPEEIVSMQRVRCGFLLADLLDPDTINVMLPGAVKCCARLLMLEDQPIRPLPAAAGNCFEFSLASDGFWAAADPRNHSSVPGGSLLVLVNRGTQGTGVMVFVGLAACRNV